MNMKQGDFFDDPAPVHRNPTSTELAAKRKTEKDLKGFRLEVFQLVQRCGKQGITGAEACWAFPTRTESSVRTRLTELCDKYDLIERTAQTRKNTRGNDEVVWVAKSVLRSADET